MGSVTIYVVDSGIPNGINVYTYDGTFDDLDGHGTGVASVIRRTNPNVLLKNVKIGLGSVGTFGQMMEAFTAIQHDATEPVNIVTCAWAVPRHHIIDDKIRELDPTKFIVVAAAGNEMRPASEFSPVNMNEVIGVGACDMYNQVMSWEEGRGSNFGPEVDVIALGIDVEVTTLDGETQIASGTSLAAARVSGQLAKLVQQFPEKNAIEIKQMFLGGIHEH
jgi:subtilisin family serine protease